MKLIVLPGNSKRNKEWADGAAAAGSSSFDPVYKHYYQHWDTGEEVINFDLELRRVTEQAGVGEFAVFAKSAGSVLTINGNYLGKFKPARCLFVGLPLGTPEQEAQLGEKIHALTVPVTIIQNTGDPYSNHARVQSFLGKINLPNITLKETPGNNHDYLYFDLIKSLVPEFFL